MHELMVVPLEDYLPQLGEVEGVVVVTQLEAEEGHEDHQGVILFLLLLLVVDGHDEGDEFVEKRVVLGGDQVLEV